MNAKEEQLLPDEFLFGAQQELNGLEGMCCHF
jgi:hypothetical protein